MDMTLFKGFSCKSIKAFCALIVFALFSLNAFAYPNDNTSYIMNYSPGTAGGWNTVDNGQCTDCHTDNGSTGTTLTPYSSSFESLVSPLAPSTQAYFYLNITSGPSTPKRGGFNLKVVNSSGTSTGSLTEFDTNAIIDGSVARHTNSTDNSWLLGWLSPSTATDVRVSYCTNSVDNNADGDYGNVSGADGDNIYCSYKAVTVNAPPVAVDDVFSVNENYSGSSYFYPITHGVNDSDAESSNASLTLTYKSSSISGATLSCSTPNERCTIALTSNYDYLDSGESVTLSGYRDYVLNDGTWTSSNTRELTDRTGRMTIRVTGSNDAPTAVDDSGYTIDEGATSTTQITAASLLLNDNDVDNSDSLSVTFLACKTNCSSVSLNGSNVQFTHDGSETTTASFTYTANDGTVDSNIATVSLVQYEMSLNAGCISKMK